MAILRQNLVVVVSQGLALGIQAHDEQETPRRRVNRDDRQFGPIAAQYPHDRIDIACPETSVPDAGRLIRTAGKHVVEDDEGPRRAVTLGVDEVAERKLEKVQTVDECEIERPAFRGDQWIGSVEVLIAGGPEEPEITLNLRTDGECGIDSDCTTSGEREAGTGSDADLEIGLG